MTAFIHDCLLNTPTNGTGDLWGLHQRPLMHPAYEMFLLFYSNQIFKKYIWGKCPWHSIVGYEEICSDMCFRFHLVFFLFVNMTNMIMTLSSMLTLCLFLYGSCFDTEMSAGLGCFTSVYSIWRRIARKELMVLLFFVREMLSARNHKAFWLNLALILYLWFWTSKL